MITGATRIPLPESSHSGEESIPESSHSGEESTTSTHGMHSFFLEEIDQANFEFYD